MQVSRIQKALVSDFTMKSLQFILCVCVSLIFGWGENIQIAP